MRTSEYYGVQVPELGDRADITVVSQAIIDSEDNQSGKVENMKATLSGSTISLVSECRTDKLVKYYNGLAVQFISPVNAQAGTAYKIKVDNLAEQPYNNKVDIKVGDMVQAIYGGTGFVSANTPIPRSSSTSSSSEVTVATSLAVKNANDNANTRALKTVQVVAGKGLTGGGDLSTNRTIDVVAADDSITVGADNIKVNTYDGLDSTSETRPASARVAKKLQDEKMPYTGGTFTGDVKMAGGKAITGAYNYGFKVLKQDGGSVFALLAQSDNKLHVGYSNSIPIMLDAQNITVNGGFATTSQDLRGAIKELNDGKLSKSGGQMTGSLEMTGENSFIGAHNYGYTLKNKLGNQEYLGYIDTDGTKGNLIIAGSNVDGVIIKNNTNVQGAVTTTGHINIGTDLSVGKSATVKKYLKIKDYYEDEAYANFWYNNQQSGYSPKSLYIDGTQNIFIDRKKVLTEANSGFVKEKLFDGVLTRTSATLPKALTEFDIIIIEGGDGNLNISIASGSARGDSKPNWYLPSMMIGNRIQYMYGDTNGTNSHNPEIDFEYLDIVDSKNIKFAYAYTNHGYYAEKTEAEIRVWGLKYVFGGK